MFEDANAHGRHDASLLPLSVSWQLGVVMCQRAQRKEEDGSPANADENYAIFLKNPYKKTEMHWTWLLDQLRTMCFGKKHKTQAHF